MKYRREIDGLRAVCVVPVIFFHARFELFSGGFIGVDVFFVVSGYLITSLILNELEKKNFSLISFYERRARRILPALFFVMFASIPFAWVLMVPFQLKDFSQSLVAQSVFSSNILFWLENDYFGAAAEEKPLLHTWSLAVEEQYYLFFPLLLVLFWRFGRKPLLYIVIGIALISFILSELGSRTIPLANFYLAPTRAWEILFGSICAIVVFKKELRSNEILSLAGISLIVLSVLLYNESTPFPSFYTLGPVLGASLVILYGVKGTLVGNFLATRLVSGLGLTSYSAYLWHQPIFAFARIGFKEFLTGWLMLVLSLVALILGYLSWRFIELPFRKVGDDIIVSRSFIFAGTFCLVLFFVVLGLWGHNTNGFLNFYTNNRLTTADTELIKLIQTHTQYNQYDTMVDDGQCKFWDKTTTKKSVLRFEECAKKHQKAIIILGDSHAMNLYNIVAKSEIYPFIFGVSAGGCRAHDQNATCYYDAFDDFLESYSNKIKIIFYHQAGSTFIEDGDGKVGSHKVFDATNEMTNLSGYKFIGENIDSVIRYLESISTFSDTIWIGPFVEGRINLFDYANLLNNLYVNKTSIRIFGELDGYIKENIKSSVELNRFRYFSLYDELSIRQDFMRVNDCITYSDAHHLSLCGEDIIANMIKPSLRSLLQ